MLSQKITLAAAATLLTGSLAISANAITTSGDVILVSPLSDVRINKSADNQNIRVFQEKQNYLLPDSVAVDFTAPGTYTSKPSGSKVVIGTRVNDYFFHSDLVPTSSPGKLLDHSFTGTITFDSPILGVIFSSNRLDSTDTTLGLATTKYPTGDSGRGLEFNGNEQVTFVSPSTLRFTFDTADNVDQMRVLTAAPGTVPEPGSFALLAGAGIAGLGCLRRRIRRNA